MRVEGPGVFDLRQSLPIQSRQIHKKGGASCCRYVGISGGVTLYFALPSTICTRAKGLLLRPVADGFVSAKRFKRLLELEQRRYICSFLMPRFSVSSFTPGG